MNQIYGKQKKKKHERRRDRQLLLALPPRRRSARGGGPSGSSEVEGRGRVLIRLRPGGIPFPAASAPAIPPPGSIIEGRGWCSDPPTESSEATPPKLFAGGAPPTSCCCCVFWCILYFHFQVEVGNGKHRRMRGSLGLLSVKGEAEEDYIRLRFRGFFVILSFFIYLFFN